MAITSRKILIAILACLMLTPAMKIGSLPEIRLEEIILLVYFLMLLILNIKGSVRTIPSAPRLILLAGLPFILFLSLSYSSINNLPVTGQDLNQFSRFFKYIVIYIIARNVSRHAPNNKELYYYMFMFTILLFIITIQQYFNIGGLNQYYVKLIAPTQYESLIGLKETVRSVGMIGNPNELGFLYSIIGIVFFNQFFDDENKRQALILTPIVFMGILMTQSRSSLLAYAIGVIIIIIVNSRSYKMLIYTLVSVSLTISIITYLINSSYLPSDLFNRFYYLMNFTEDESWQLRVSYHWEENLKMFYQYPIAGTGPLRSIEQAAADNEWILLLRTYGIIGTIYIAYLFLINSFNGYKINTITVSITAACFLYMTTSAVFHSLVLMPIILLIFGYTDNKKCQGVSYE